MVKQFKWARIALIVTAIGVLSSCETVDTVKNVFADPIILACPETRILADASEIIRYVEGGGRDLTDVDTEGKIQNMALACLTKIDRETRVGIMEVEVRFNIAASRGPANRSRKATYPYLIIVTDLNKNIVYREKFSVGVSFAGNQSKLSLSNDPITIELPLRPDIIGKSYLIYGGFALTREQLKHSRLRRKQRSR